MQADSNLVSTVARRPPIRTTHTIRIPITTTQRKTGALTKQSPRHFLTLQAKWSPKLRNSPLSARAALRKPRFSSTLTANVVLSASIAMGIRRYNLAPSWDKKSGGSILTSTPAPPSQPLVGAINTRHVARNPPHKNRLKITITHVSCRQYLSNAA